MTGVKNTFEKNLFILPVVIKLNVMERLFDLCQDYYRL